VRTLEGDIAPGTEAWHAPATMAATLRDFEAMWNAYPNPGGSAEDAKRTIGGGVDVDWITNTCVIRMSRSFNASGNTIPDKDGDGLATVKGADGRNYAMRVREFTKWLRKRYGAADLVYDYPPPGGGDIPASFLGRQGVIVFEVEGWSDATGHVDLWNGARCRHHDYFARAQKVLVWEVPDVIVGPQLGASVGKGGKNAPEDVTLVQQLLTDRGEDPGPVDGVCGARTIAAIRAFQARFLAHPDSRVDPGGRTIRELLGQ
jgi:hypothetical protein